jgi:predicted transcriptional regulator
VRASNTAIRERVRSEGLYLWQVAEAMGISDSSFSRKLRRELPVADQEKIQRLIDEIVAERGAEHEA